MGKIYLLYGAEKYDLYQKVEKIKKEFSNLEVGINFFNMDSSNISELPSICEEVSFFGAEKLVIIKDTKLKFDITPLVENVNSGVTAVIIEDTVDKRLTQYKQLAKVAEVLEFKSMEPNEIIDYIVRTLKRYDISISRQDASYMESICLDDKSNIINELNKIVNYLGDRKEVTKEDIDKVCSKNFNAKIFDLLDNIVRKNKEKAVYQLDELLAGKEPIVKIYIMLYKQIKQILLIKLAKDAKINEAAKYLEINPYVYKNLSRVADSFNKEELRDLIYEFDSYDEKTKNGEMDFVIGLKKIIYSM